MYIYVYISSFLFVLLCGAGAHAALLDVFYLDPDRGEWVLVLACLPCPPPPNPFVVAWLVVRRRWKGPAIQ